MQKESKDQQQSNSKQQVEKNIDNNAQIDQFDQVLNNFDENPLNLTNQQKNSDDDEEDPEAMAKIKEQYEKFMREMQGGLSDDPNPDMGSGDMQNLGNMFGNLLKGLTEEMGGDSPEGDVFGKKFADMFKSISEDNVQEAATKLLNQFMDKSLLLEPMQETKVNYEQYFQKCNKGKISVSQTDMENYRKQFQIVNQIISTLQNDQGNKSQMIRLFEEMQKYGSPPQGIAPQTGSFY